MNILFDSIIGSENLRVLVSVHELEPATPLLTIERGGMSEYAFKDATELRLCGEAIRLAGIRLMEQGL